jgi:hypothetical protein
MKSVKTYLGYNSLERFTMLCIPIPSLFLWLDNDTSLNNTEPLHGSPEVVNMTLFLAMPLVSLLNSALFTLAHNNYYYNYHHHHDQLARWRMQKCRHSLHVGTADDVLCCPLLI